MNIEQVLEGAQGTLNAHRVFGEPIEIDGNTILPTSAVRGGGGGGSKDHDGGGGFGMDARPAGVFVVNKHGHVKWQPAIDVNRIVLGSQIVAVTALLTLRPLVRWWVARRH
jgi:uncharacterized spore protein YtfJ